MGKRKNPEVNNKTEKRPRFLGYALPRAERDRESRVHSCEGFDLHDEPLGATVSFLDYDGVVVFAGSFEAHEPGAYGQQIVCKAPADLDLREREFFTGVESGKIFVLLVARLLTHGQYSVIESNTDLFRRIAKQFEIYLTGYESPSATLTSSIPDFKNYISRLGVGYVTLGYGEDEEEWITPICTQSDHTFGIIIGDRIFVLPSAIPQTHEQLVQIVTTAIEAVLAYRHRTSKHLPGWAASFSFSKEASLRQQANDLHEQVVKLQAEVDAYTAYKGGLCYQSTPLVELVGKVCEDFFGITLSIDDQRIEDATLNEAGKIVAVFEVKGVKGNFERKHVNQVDSHRERLGVPSSVPGILVMNTIMSATSLTDKDQRPHPDIVKKAVADNVLLVRTLDLLRYANAVESGIVTKDSFRQVLLSKPGWLKVEGDQVQVVEQ